MNLYTCRFYERTYGICCLSQFRKMKGDSNWVVLSGLFEGVKCSLAVILVLLIYQFLVYLKIRRSPYFLKNDLMPFHFLQKVKSNRSGNVRINTNWFSFKNHFVSLNEEKYCNQFWKKNLPKSNSLAEWLIYRDKALSKQNSKSEIWENEFLAGML